MEAAMKRTSLLLTAVLALAASSIAIGDEKDVASQLEAAKRKVSPEFTLAYKFKAGDDVVTKVVHLVTLETTVQGVSQTASTRSVSAKRWQISSVDASGNITFVHSVPYVEMWQKVTGRDEVKYDSRNDEKPPPGYEGVARDVGVPLATIVMDPYGRIIGRQNAQPQFNPGIGTLTIPLPGQPVKIGDKWSIPDEVRVRLEDGTVKKVATRQVYQLQSVETGVATISVDTQVLTPVNDPKIESQLVQRMQKGTIKFDIDAGRLLRKQMDLDEQVIGFNGPNSSMQYLARFTEEPLDATSVANVQKATKTK
jgi:hypothetical protein